MIAGNSNNVENGEYADDITLIPCTKTKTTRPATSEDVDVHEKQMNR
jgi:hypothetical protein